MTIKMLPLVNRLFRFKDRKNIAIRKVSPIRKNLLKLERLEDRWNPANPSMVADLNVTNPGSIPENLTAIQGKVYFTADDEIHGRELWVTDGTESGTQLVKDIYPGKSSSGISGPFVPSGKFIYFTANDGVHGAELWKTDGTGKGTVRVTDLFSDTDPRPISSMVDFHGNLFFFTSFEEPLGTRLFKTDGTSFGTHYIKTVLPFDDIAWSQFGPDFLQVTNEHLFFTTRDEKHSVILWVSDGTKTGTIQLARTGYYYSGELDLVKFFSKDQFCLIENTLYFPGNDPDFGTELWKSDGTLAGTVRVTDIAGGTQSSDPDNLVAVNGSIYYLASDSNGIRSLWKTDGSGTLQVFSFPGGSDQFNKHLKLFEFQSNLYFFSNSSDYFDGKSEQIWRTDTSTGKTFQYTNINIPSKTVELHSTNKNIFFITKTTTGYELWKIDETEMGASMVRDIWPGESGGLAHFSQSDQPIVASIGKVLIFSARNANQGIELWRSDGTRSGTFLVKDIETRTTLGSQPKFLMNINDFVLFSAFINDLDEYSGDGHNVIYSTNANKTYKLAEFSSQAKIRNVTFFKNEVYFTVSDFGTKLWKTDGTPAGTRLIKDTANLPIPVEPDISDSAWMIVLNGLLLFAADDLRAGAELWRSDGTSSGTYLVKDIKPGKGHSLPWTESYFTPYFYSHVEILNGAAYFPANDGVHGEELWRTDGTREGTYLVKDIFEGESGSQIGWLTKFNNNLYFSAKSENSYSVLWKTDGTSSGTLPVQDAPREMTAHYPGSFKVINNNLYFITKKNYDELHLWKTDGSNLGTFEIGLIGRNDYFAEYSNIVPFRNGFFYTNEKINEPALPYSIYTINYFDLNTNKFTVIINNAVIYQERLYASRIDHAFLGDRMYFLSNGLWSTDGTTENTLLVKSFNTESITNYPSLTGNGSFLFFRNFLDPSEKSNQDNPRLESLWQSDGTMTGTKIIGTLPGDPPRFDWLQNRTYPFQILKNRVFYSASDGIHGQELWSFEFDQTIQVNRSFLPIFGSQGSFERGYPDWQSRLVYGLYETLLNRKPDSKELRHWVGLLSISYTPNSIASVVLQSREYLGLQVESYYQRFLNRTADAAGKNHWIQRLSSGFSEQQVIVEILSSRESLNRFKDAPSFVKNLYSLVLDRNPTYGEVLVWVSRLAGKIDRKQAIRQLIYSQEATQRESRDLAMIFSAETGSGVPVTGRPNPATGGSYKDLFLFLLSDFAKQRGWN